MYCWMKLWTNIKNILLQISGLLLTKALMTTPLKSHAHQTSFIALDAPIYFRTRNEHHQEQYLYLPLCYLQCFLSRCRADTGPRKLHSVILSAPHHSAFHSAALSCSGNYEGEVRCVNSTQKPRYSYGTLISVCLQTEYQPKEYQLYSAQSFLLFCNTSETLLGTWLIQLLNYSFIHSEQVNYSLQTSY